MKRIVILVSGDGSNFQAILNSCKKKEIFGRIVAVVSDNCQAFAIERARVAHISTHVLVPAPLHKEEHIFNQELMQVVDLYSPDLVILAGYMRILNADIVASYSGRILNIHPSLLPKYPGLYTHRKAIQNSDAQHGASVHFVTDKIDEGPVIVQARVPVFHNDSEYTLSMRVKEQEHSIYPLAVKWFTEGRLKMHNNAAWLDGYRLPQSGYIDVIERSL
ncbi:Phosphoribosylglycinamide formyltransferase [Candidatus Erwinia haradaeae]|uniref:Phosphoribosylglycinamide formyltransferase n=1 Tax=Candidatus Erwinia haradaeae TaxID=1922217 RepID=A0A451DBY8_9GAMM|nr:phosphoribosylglycinamide formyltransferase [Candidatus Erwinia haradaeae]VFP83905.1 Phosphoribosylglycinamide formyltransferase [Candidatus Erwinia haradaeae]